MASLALYASLKYYLSNSYNLLDKLISSFIQSCIVDYKSTKKKKKENKDNESCEYANVCFFKKM